MSTWTLLGPDRKPYASELRGTLGGHSRSRVCGRLDCPAALRAIPRGGYLIHRVFFLDEGRCVGRRPSPLRDVPATDLATATIDPRRAGVNCQAQIEVTTNGPLEVTLAGCNRVIRGPQGATVARVNGQRQGHPLVF